MLNVVVVEDNEAIRDGLKILIDGTEGYACVGAYEDCESMLKHIKKLDPNVMLMDLGMPGMGGIEGIKKVRAILPELTILVLTIYEENDRIFEALVAGASGYLIKKTPPSKLLDAIKEAYEGGAPMSAQIARKVIEFFQNPKSSVIHKNDYVLTPREKEILSGLSGRS